MKTKIVKLMILIIMCTLFTGCNNDEYQKDESYETNIVGTYSMGGKDAFLKLKYEFNDENFKYFGFQGGSSSNSTGTIKTTKINDELFCITFNVEETTYIPNSKDFNANSIDLADQSQIYKYKNMLGYIYKANDIPKSKTFDYIFYSNNEKKSGLVFTQDGYTHTCSNVDNCQCDYANDVQYIRKNNIIYWNVDKLSNKDYWTIGYYVTDIGLFQPLVYKIKE